MKYVVLIGDGMADEPLPELRGKTPLEAAKTPNMDWIAKNGEVGLVNTIPDGMKPGSDVGALSIFGYDPQEYYTGRAPLEAASMGVKLGPKDVAYRCNLVTVRGGDMEDYSAGHVSTAESRKLIKFLQDKLGSKTARFYPGVSYRHLLVLSGGPMDLTCYPPHDIQGRSIAERLPSGDGSEIIHALMKQSVILLRDHPVNIRRIQRDQNPANMIWLWGQGKATQLESYQKRFGIKGSVVSAVDVVKGPGTLLGLKTLKVPGITGYFDTNYVGKAQYALKALKKDDIVFIHVESPDEAGHMGDMGAKIRAIEDIDQMVLGTVLKGIKKFKEYKILVLPDHPTPVARMGHTSDSVPYAIYNSKKKWKGPSGYNEKAAHSTKRVVSEGHELMPYFLKST